MVSRVIDAAIRVADAVPATRGKYVSDAKVYWPLILELRAALDAAGIEWKGRQYDPSLYPVNLRGGS